MNKRQAYNYGPGKNRKGLSSSDWIGIILGLAAVLAFAGLGYWIYKEKSAKVQYNATSYCPLSGPFATTVLLIDLTDEISFLQEQKITNFIHSLATASGEDVVQKHDMLAVYLLKESDADTIPTPVVQVCNPGDGQGLNEFTGNPRLANKRFSDSFVKPIDAAIANIVSAQSANISPIIESIRGISLTAFSKEPHAGHEHRLIVISDMLQNSPQISHYKHGQKQTKEELQKFSADLSMVSRVDIKVLDRSGSERLQGKDLVEFWRAYFRVSGTSLTSAERWAK